MQSQYDVRAVESSAPSSSDRLREYLLRLTIEHAVSRSPFYQRSLGALARDVDCLAGLAKLPLLRKSDLCEHLDELRTFRHFPDQIMYTSGTTGAPLEVPVYQEEIEAYNEIILSCWRERVGGEVPLTLSVLRVGHGSHVLTRDIPTVPCHINYGIDQLISHLRSYHWINGRRERIRILDANVLNLRQITNELLASGINPSSFELEVVCVSGWFLPSYEREVLEQIWKAPVLDRYGVTEVNGDAKWCPICAGYHFDFIVVPEVLEPSSLEAIDEGIGYMTLTGLYPFNQAIPKIRYVLGDLVEARKASCGSREKAVRFLSRIEHAVLAPQGGFRLFPTDVAEVLAPLPDIARKDKTGFLKFDVSTTPDGEARIELELVYDPALYPRRVDRVRSCLLEGLQKRLSDPGHPEISCHRPGGLQRITKV